MADRVFMPRVWQVANGSFIVVTRKRNGLWYGHLINLHSNKAIRELPTDSILTHKQFPEVKPFRDRLPAQAVALLEEARDFEKGKDGKAF